MSSAIHSSSGLVEAKSFSINAFTLNGNCGFLPSPRWIELPRYNAPTNGLPSVPVQPWIVVPSFSDFLSLFLPVSPAFLRVEAGMFPLFRMRKRNVALLIG
jgi:hypothetical protein